MPPNYVLDWRLQMNIHSPSQNVLVKTSYIVPITAATVNGTGVDTEGYTRAFAVVVAAPSGSGTTSTTTLQDSPDNTTFTNVTGATFTSITTAGGTGVLTMDINLADRQRYLRLVHTGAGGSAAGEAAGLIELFNPQQAAVVQDHAAISV